MGQIPVGDFGQRVARPMQAPQVRQSEALVNAQNRAAQAGTQVATDMAEQDTRNRLQALSEEEHKAREAANAALKAKSVLALNGAQDALKDLHDEVTNGVLNGTVDKAKAEATWRERAGKVLSETGKDLPEDRRALMAAELSRDADRLGNGVRKAVTLRDRHDVKAGIDQTLEFLQRQYRTDPEGATRRATALLEQLGPHSTMTPEQVAQKGQAWKEGTQYTAGFELVTAGRHDRKALDAAEKTITTGLPDLDPQKRAGLLDRVSSYRFALDQRDELAAQRLQRKADALMKKAEAEFNTFQAMADKGTILAPEYIDRALQATAGTPYAAGIKALAQQARDVGGLAAQPLPAQRAQLQQIDALIAQQGRTPELDKRRTQVEKVLNGSLQDLERDPLRAGLERGVITELAPLQQGGGLPAMVQQLQQRVPLAERVSTWAGRPVSPLTADEAAQLKHQLDALPAKERSGFVAAIAQAVGPQQAQGMAKQMDGKDRGLALALAAGADATTAGRFTGELILKGQAAKADGTSTKGQKQPEVKAAGWRAHAAAALDGVFANAEFSGQVAQAAELIMHGMASERGGDLSKDDMDRAVRLAIGGSIVERNGQKLPLPAGVEPSAFEKRIESVSADELRGQVGSDVVVAGGSRIPLGEFVKTLPGQQLMPVRRGQYAVIVGGRPVMSTTGQPVLIGVR